MRLTEKGYQAGLISEERYRKFLAKKKMIEDEIARVEKTVIGAGKEVQDFLLEMGSTPLKTSATLADLIRRPELDYRMLKQIDKNRTDIPEDVQEEVSINIKYEGYIRRQKKQVEQFKKLETRKIPSSLDYDQVPSLRTEARQKLKKIHPISVGQASRISGVSPADISVLLVYLETFSRREGRNEN